MAARDVKVLDIIWDSLRPLVRQPVQPGGRLPWDPSARHGVAANGKTTVWTGAVGRRSHCGFHIGANLNLLLCTFRKLE